MSTSKQDYLGLLASMHCPENKGMFIILGSTAIIIGPWDHVIMR